MSESETSTAAPPALLRRWLRRQLPEEGWRWLDGQLDKLADDPTDRSLHLVLGLIPRRLGKALLALDPDDLRDADRARCGWRPGGWSVDGAARVLALRVAAGGNRDFARRFAELCRYADIGELIALYRGLPLYPEPAQLLTQATEGVRTNMRAVFEAVAHDNPYPRERFDPPRWNQMVLKALFVGSRLAPIQGLDERANEDLARTLCDYAHERWAAGRPVSGELWRCVGPFARGPMLDDLQRVLTGDDPAGRAAAALALAASPDPRAGELLAVEPALAEAARDGTLSWQRLDDAGAAAASEPAG